MKYRALGTTGLMPSEVGLGCASYWGMTRFDESEALRVVHAALDNGVTYFDTGSSYSGGNAEPRLGRALASTANRQDLVISSKAGTCIDHHGHLYKDFSPQNIRSSVEHSLQNLGLTSLPLLYLHGPQIKDLNDDLLRCLTQLREEGKIQFLGINSFDTHVIEHVATLSAFNVVMINYNILRPENAGLIEKLAAKGIGVMAGMALGCSLYSRQIFHPHQIKDVWYLLRALKNHRSDLMRGLKLHFLERENPDSASQIALAWVLNNRLVSCAVAGTTSVAHLIDNVAASDYALNGSTLASIAEAQTHFHSRPAKNHVRSDYSPHNPRPA